MDTSNKNKRVNNENIIPKNNLLTFEKLVVRWNLPDEVVIAKLFKLRPLAYSVLRSRSNKTYGHHYYCAKVDYDDDLIDSTGEFREILHETIKRQVVFNLEDIKQLEKENDELFCDNAEYFEQDTDNSRLLNLKSLKERREEFDNCTAEEIDSILIANPKPTKGQRNCLLAAKFYISDTLSAKDIYIAVTGNKHTKDPASQTRRWLREAKEILPGLRSKFRPIKA